VTKLFKQHRLPTRRAGFFVFCFLFLFLRLPSLFEPYWYGDEGIYLALGQGISKGLTLYRQIHDNKPPALYYLAALGQTVFGFRLLLLFWMIPTLYFFYRLSRKFLSSKLSVASCFLFLVLSSIPVIEGNIANAEIFMLLPTILAFYLFPHYLFLVGLLLGVAFTIKIPVFIEVIFLLAWLLILNFKNIKLLIINYSLLITGFTLPIFFWAIYFFFKKAFPEFLFAALIQNFGYLSSWATGTHSGSATSGGLLARFVLLFLFWVSTYYLYLKKIIGLKPFFLLAWISATIFGVLLSTRPYPHYLIQVLPPFCLLMPLAFRDRRFLLVPLFLFLVIIKYKFYFYPTLSYYSNFYLHRNNPEFFGTDVINTYKISDYVKQHTQADDRIFVWGDAAYIYALSNRLPASRYTVAYHIVDFNAHDSTISQLKAFLPKLVVYYPMSQRPFPELDSFLNRYYFLSSQIGSALIYQLQE